MVAAKPSLEVEERSVFRCPICHADYPSRVEAQACLDQGVDRAVAKVGDIVIISYGYGWFDGDVRWVINPKVRVNPGKEPSPAVRPCPKKKGGGCFDSCCSMGFYYVVTDVDLSDEHPHRTRYHVFTKAMTGKRRPMGGYTFSDQSRCPNVVKRPKPFLIKDSADLIGEKAEFLL